MGWVVRLGVGAESCGVFVTPSGGYDLLVLGCGPAGVKAALEAAGRGLHVAVVEPLAKPTGAPTGAYSKCIREAAPRPMVERSAAVAVLLVLGVGGWGVGGWGGGGGGVL